MSIYRKFCLFKVLTMSYFFYFYFYLFIYFFAPQFCLKVDFFNKLRTETGELIEDDAKGESNG